MCRVAPHVTADRASQLAARPAHVTVKQKNRSERIMAHHNDQIDLEQTLTKRLAALPVPIRIIHHKPEHGAWYQWKTLLTGTGDCGTFADAVIGAITHQQEQHEAQRLIATPARYTLETVATLGECLRRTRKV